MSQYGFFEGMAIDQARLGARALIQDASMGSTAESGRFEFLQEHCDIPF